MEIYVNKVLQEKAISSWATSPFDFLIPKIAFELEYIFDKPGRKAINNIVVFVDRIEVLANI